MQVVIIHPIMNDHATASTASAILARVDNLATLATSKLELEAGQQEHCLRRMVLTANLLDGTESNTPHCLLGLLRAVTDVRSRSHRRNAQASPSRQPRRDVGRPAGTHALGGPRGRGAQGA